MSRTLLFILAVLILVVLLNKAYAITCDYYITTGNYEISNSGIYCLSQDISGNITIHSSNVILEGQGHTVYNGIVSLDVAYGYNITIENLKIYSNVFLR
jgi:hypothetical protein